MHRSKVSWRALTLAACTAVAFAGAGGCDEDRVEDCFEAGASLSQVTTDTLITDHLDASLSPDGTRVLFTTDYWGIEELEDKNERDFAIIELPVAGDPARTPVERLTDVGNARRVMLPSLLSDIVGDPYNPDRAGSNIGECVWLDDLTFIGVVEEPDQNLPRMYRFELDPAPLSPGEIDIVDATLIDDGFLDRTAPDISTRDQVYYVTPAVSPDGQWVAYTRYFFRDEQPQAVPPRPALAIQPAIYALNLATGDTVRVTNGSTVETDPAWSPDGTRIAFTSNGGTFGMNEVYSVAFDPASPAPVRRPGEAFTDGRVRLTDTNVEPDVKIPVGAFDPTWLADGRIVFVSNRRAPCTADRRRNLWIMNGDGSGAALFHLSEWDDHYPASTNLMSASPNALGTVVFSSRTNPVEDFNGEKNDLYILRF